jgi:hypothetical protein
MKTKTVFIVVKESTGEICQVFESPDDAHAYINIVELHTGVRYVLQQHMFITKYNWHNLNNLMEQGE